MKIEPYVSMDVIPNEKPVFSIRFSDEHSCFDIIDVTEEEVREIIKHIEEQLTLQLETYSRLQTLVLDKRRTD